MYNYKSFNLFKERIWKIIKFGNFPDNTVVISYYDPNAHKIDKNYAPVDYSDVCDNVFYVGFDDIDINYLEKQSYIKHILQKPSKWQNLYTMHTTTAWI